MVDNVYYGFAGLWSAMETKVSIKLIIAAAFAALGSAFITIGMLEPDNTAIHIIASKALDGGIIGGITVVAIALIGALWWAIKEALGSKNNSSQVENNKSNSDHSSVSTHGDTKYRLQGLTFTSSFSGVQLTIIVTSTVIGAVILALIFLWFGPSNFKECVFEKMKGQPSVMLEPAVVSCRLQFACNNKFKEEYKKCIDDRLLGHNLNYCFESASAYCHNN